MIIIYVALGGAIGATLRYLGQSATHRLLGDDLPWGTLVVNVLGGFAMGILAVIVLGRWPHLTAFVGIGVLGGFTTFSTFSLDLVRLAERGAYGLAAGYAVTSVVFSVLALFAGMAIARNVVAS